MVKLSIIAPIAYVLMMTLAQTAIITDKRIMKPSASILSNKSDERVSTAPDDEFQSSFHKVGVYNDDVPTTEIDSVPAIINEINKHPINIAATSNNTPKNELSAQPSTSLSFEQVNGSSLSDRKIDPASKTRKMMDTSHIGNDQDLSVDAVESIIRRKRDLSCNNRYTGDCQDLETASICPWRYIWDSNGPQNVECLTCKPTVGCDANCLLTCQPWYIDGRAVACLAALPCTHAS